MAKVYVGVGHGGSDPGAVSGAHKESIYALDIATACTEELRRHGVSVLQSRIIDEYESASAKVKECNVYAPDIALDIHLNSSVKHNADGFEIYHTVNGGKGKDLAQRVETAVKAIGQNSRGVKIRLNTLGRDYFGIIRQTNCPAVLVECAFIDSVDVQIVDTLAERKRMGVAIAHGILAYFGITIKAQISGSDSQKTNYKPYIKKYQSWLNTKYATGLVVDGLYGKNTKKASIKAVQKTIGVTPDGVFGKNTKNALRTVKKGTQGTLVYVVQGLMYCKGFDPKGFDGKYGTNTVGAVKTYQKANGLEADGVVGKNTWVVLLG